MTLIVLGRKGLNQINIHNDRSNVNSIDDHHHIVADTFALICQITVIVPTLKTFSNCIFIKNMLFVKERCFLF